MKMLGLILLFSFGVSAFAQGVGGSGGTGIDVVGLPDDPRVELAALKKGKSSTAFIRFPYYMSQVSCDSVKASLEYYGGLVIYQKPNLFDIYVEYGALCPLGETDQVVRVKTSDGICVVRRCNRTPSQD